MTPFSSSPLLSENEPPSPAIEKPEVDAAVLTSIDPGTLNDSFVYVHCHFSNKWKDMLIRIWRTTFLIDRLSGTRAKLLHAENITIAPTWMQIPDNVEFSFLLIFEGLPKSCTLFDLVEEIAEPGGFFVGNISRNESDVYHISIA